MTKEYKVYGMDGHRQKASFRKSVTYNFSEPGDLRIITIFNGDKTGTNEYSIVVITRNTLDECDKELDSQISDGYFENCRVGMIEDCVLFAK